MWFGDGKCCVWFEEAVRCHSKRSLTMFFVFSDVSGNHHEMSSFPETRVERFINKKNSKDFVRYPFRLTLSIKVLQDIDNGEQP